MKHVVQPPPRGGGGQSHRAVCRIRRVRDQPLDVLTTQHGGPRPGWPRRRHAERGPGARPHRAVEEPTRIDGEVARAPRPLAMADEIPQRRLHLRIGHLIGGTVVVPGRAAHGGHVRLAGAHRPPAHHRVVIHPSSTLRQHTPPSCTSTSTHARPHRSTDCVTEDSKAGRRECGRTATAISGLVQRRRSPAVAHDRAAAVGCSACWAAI
jgi:hypothetical protein